MRKLEKSHGFTVDVLFMDVLIVKTLIIKIPRTVINLRFEM